MWYKQKNYNQIKQKHKRRKKTELTEINIQYYTLQVLIKAR